MPGLKPNEEQTKNDVVSPKIAKVEQMGINHHRSRVHERSVERYVQAIQGLQDIRDRDRDFLDSAKPDRCRQGLASSDDLSINMYVNAAFLVYTSKHLSTFPRFHKVCMTIGRSW